MWPQSSAVKHVKAADSVCKNGAVVVRRLDGTGREAAAGGGGGGAAAAGCPHGCIMCPQLQIHPRSYQT